MTNDDDLVQNPIADPGVPTMPREMAQAMQSMQPAFAFARRLAAAMAAGIPCDDVMREIHETGHDDLVYDTLIAQTGEFVLAVVDGLRGDKELAAQWFEQRALAQLDLNQ